jgi:hypothetical protein
LGGVIQQPTTDYTVNTSTIIFTTAPASGLSFFAILMGDALNTSVPADGSITSAKLAGSLSVGFVAGSASTPSLFFTGDLNTGIYSPGADQVAITTNGVERVEWGTSEVVFNDGGANYDFRIEGDTNSSLFFVDASAEAVGIGTTTPQKTFVVSSSGAQGIELAPNDAGAGSNRLISYNRNTSAYTDLTIEGLSLQFQTNNGTERARIDSSGRLLVGTSSTRGNFFNTTGVDHLLQIETTGYYAQSWVSNGGTVATGGAYLTLGRTRGTTAGSNTAVASGDTLGVISFQGADGSQLVDGARIDAVVDGTPGADDLPTRLVFSTTADGASSPTERVRIESIGRSIFTFPGDSANGSQAILVDVTNTSYNGTCVNIDCNRSATSAYWFIAGLSGNGADVEFRITGDGNGFCDGSWSGGGADYAEYFEWSDGNPDEDDRRGICVVLDGEKIRPAVEGEDPIGVISGNPSVVGDSAWNKWSGKYLRDDFGSYILDENNERQLSPDYDPDQEYISREDRPEWDCVGLMGKLRIRKGQPTGSRWIKMRDISPSVEEWLVR